jgi:hydrogenase maturation protein HypF
MMLERYLSTDPDILKYSTADTKRVLHAPTIIETTPLFKHVLLDISSVEGELTRKDRSVIATEFIHVLTRHLAECAAEAAQEEGINKIGVTGGVAYNIPIMDMFALHLEKLGMELVTHDQIPSGDGGISIGQNLIAADKLQS